MPLRRYGPPGLIGRWFKRAGGDADAAPPRKPDAVERSHRLARLPDRLAVYGDLRMRTPEFLAFAKRWQALVPYPPDDPGRWDWVRGDAA